MTMENVVIIVILWGWACSWGL